jgi:tetratricopeptide (TPR) repeat protein
MRMIKIGLSVLVAATLCGAIAGCGGGEGPGPAPVTYESKIEAGWRAFGENNYNSALSEFKAAVEMNPERVEGFDGSGWSYALLDSLEESMSSFDGAASRDTTLIDPLMGRAAAALGLSWYDYAITDASRALSKDPRFVFERRTSYDWRDLHLILAECYYATADYDSALAHSQALDPQFDPDPLAEDYLELLLLEIEALVAVHGGI